MDAFEVAAPVAQRRVKNRDYDDVAGVVWQVAVYEPVHDGRPFTNIGGRRALDVIGAFARLGEGTHVLDVGCGLGETSRYLAERYGCEVTGIDVNAEQIARARAATSNSARVHFLQQDVLLCPAARPYAAICAVDTLSLVPRTRHLVRRLAAMLQPNGALGVADLVAGPAMTASLREQLWRADGFVSLPTLDEYGALLRAAGCVDVELLDRRPWAVACFAAIDKALHTNGDAIAREAGRDVVDAWRRMAGAYHEAFRRGALGYAVILGRSGASASS